MVAPHAGAWIEMYTILNLYMRYFVAPHAGAWIEMSGKSKVIRDSKKSHPMRVRGLK